MSRRVIWRLLAGAGAVGLVAAGGIALAAPQNHGPGRSAGRPHLSERQILRIAEKAARYAGDRHPRLIQHSEGTRHAANLVASGDGVPGHEWSYLIAERGHFVLRNAHIPPGARAPRGSVLTLVVNASTGEGTDGGVSSHYPDLARLGSVHTDLRRARRHQHHGS